MKGTIRKRGATWSYKHEIAPHPVTGKRRTCERGGFSTKKAAQEALNAALHAINRGEDVERERTTLREYLGEWMPRYATTVRPSTVARNESLIRAHILPRLGHMLIQRIRPADIEDFYVHCLNGDATANPLRPSTIRSIHGLLSKALGDAERHGRIVRNPVSLAKPPKVEQDHERTGWWNKDESRAFLAAHEGGPRHAMWHVALFTGLRRGELLGLRWSDVDLDNAMIRVTQQFVAPSHEGHFANPKSKTARRTVEITAVTAATLRAHRARQNEYRLAAGTAWSGDLVFGDEVGQPLLPRTVSAWFKRDVEAANAPNATLHDLRHTHASLLIAAGVNPKVVQERLGHADVTITLRTYSHVMPGMQKQAAVAFGELLA